jgi:hypothetical protein
MNDASLRLLEGLMKAVAGLGLPLIIAAWFGVLACAVGMALVLKRYLRTRVWLPAAAVGIVSLAAHMLDFFGTLRVMPDLSSEANPIWRVVVAKLGLRAAWWYGFTGKVLLAVLGFEFFAYYLAARKRLMPGSASGFFDFWKRFGATDKPFSLEAINVFFSFLFGLIGPFSFYVAYLNSLTDLETYNHMPAMPVMLAAYLVALTIAFLFGNYWSFHRERG